MQSNLQNEFWTCNTLISVISLPEIHSISRHDNVKMSSIFRPATDTVSSSSGLISLRDEIDPANLPQKLHKLNTIYLLSLEILLAEIILDL